jgi:c-di-GMP-related signal transduction protein
VISQTSDRPAALPIPTNQFVARQPIFNQAQQVFGYELLFRNGLENCFSASDVDQACCSTVDSSLLMGLDFLCGETRAFINCTRDALVRGVITVLPHSSAVVEVLETVPPDSEVAAACQNLKQAGYLIALDDFVPDDPREPLIPLTDIIKLDLKRTPRNRWQSMVKVYAPKHIAMLAEKVETQSDFAATRSMGFDYFQGYFFQKPVVLSTPAVPALYFHYVLMLQVVNQSEIDLRRLEALIKQEASLCYRLLRYLNSAAFAFVAEIRSIKHALGLLGERDIRKWIALVAALGAGKDKPPELVRCALIRAHFCETISHQLCSENHDGFLLGLLSLMDAILGMNMPELLQKVHIDHEVMNALLGQPCQLHAVYQLVVAEENADWAACERLTAELRLRESTVAKAYVDAIRWAAEVTTLASEPSP